MSRAGRATAEDRVRRLLAIIPWVAGQPGGVPIEEVCDRFATSRDELVRDLESILPYVGVSPFTPDTLVDVALSDDWVSIRPQWFDRPPRLTADQALALLAAGAGLANLPGYDPEGPLASALAKVAAVVGGRSGGEVDVDLGHVAPEVQATLEEARRSARAVEIDYLSFNRDERTRRVVEPWQVANREGRWYLLGHCRTAGDERLFRIDRIAEATLLDETFEPPEAPPDAVGFQPGEEQPTVTLDLDAVGARIIERDPHEVVEELPDGGVRVVLAVTERPYLERLRLLLGPHARVHAADPGLEGVGRAAAERVRARYGR